MRRRRPRIFRDDVLAPWLTLAVMLGIWWLGARIIGPENAMRQPVEARGAPRTPDAAPRRERPAGGAVRSETPARAYNDTAVLADPDDGGRTVPASAGEIGELVSKQLAVPVAGIEASSLKSTFTESRSGGRRHEAMDILAPRGTAVVAAGEGRIVKLFTSALGGLTIYQFDPEERFCYYYAHLDGYAADLTEGQLVQRGQVIGYVGTTGNAPPGTPHLHFAIYKLGPEKRWWDGAAIDPQLVLR
jgi:murein DD-endopeptidase MepM/ murein hydrolase activator NlpD